VIAAPPSDAGAVHDTDACPSPAVAVTPVGAPGAVTVGAGVTALLAALGADVPAALLAVTVKVYAVPLVNPPTVALVAEAAAVVVAPSLAVIV